MSIALLIGYGSIGKRHLDEILRIYQTIHILDSKFVEAKPGDLSNSNRIRLFNAFYQIPRNQIYDLVVIATWGPTHLELTQKIIPFRPRFLLLEKPVESSLEKVDSLEKLIEKESIPSAVNFSLRYGPLKSHLQDIMRTNLLGELCSVVVSGGAKCLATNGIHYLDLFMQLLDEIPHRVISSISNNLINPRSPDLSYLGGVANFIFSADRILTINFSNSSYADIKIDMVFERGRLSYMNSILRAWKSEDPSVFESRPVNRSVRFDHQFLNIDLSKLKLEDGMSKLYGKLVTSPREFRITNFTESTRQIIRACMSSEVCPKSALTTSRLSDDYKKDWKIS